MVDTFDSIGHFKYEALNRLISRRVCAPFKIVSYEKCKYTVKWKVDVRIHHSLRVVEGYFNISEISQEAEVLRKRYDWKGK